MIIIDIIYGVLIFLTGVCCGVAIQACWDQHQETKKHKEERMMNRIKRMISK